MENAPPSLPGAFAQIVTDSIPAILAHQQPDGAIVYDPAAPIVYPQQAIFPLAFCYAGLGPDKRFRRSAALQEAILRLGDWLLAHFDDHGCIHFDSYGYAVGGVEQRLTYAWLEALHILRTAQADFPFDRWADKILRAAETLVESNLRRLDGLRHFTMLTLGTSTNHVALYLTTVYRAGQVLDRPDLCQAVLPIARALAQDIHPDGYWEEHGDLSGTAGPTPSYNYLTHCAIALFCEWTQEPVFLAAIEKSTAFHGNFCYPDGAFLELIDERVRHDPAPGRASGDSLASRIGPPAAAPPGRTLPPGVPTSAIPPPSPLKASPATARISSIGTMVPSHPPRSKSRSITHRFPCPLPSPRTGPGASPSPPCPPSTPTIPPIA